MLLASYAIQAQVGVVTGEGVGWGRPECMVEKLICHCLLHGICVFVVFESPYHFQFVCITVPSNTWYCTCTLYLYV